MAVDSNHGGEETHIKWDSEGLSWKALRGRFEELKCGEVKQHERRVLGVAIYLAYIVGTPMALFGGPGWTLLAGFFLLLSAAAYWPLRTYSRGLSHRAGNKMLLARRELDYDEKERLFDGLDRTVWAVTGLFVVFLTYWTLSARYGWWQPETLQVMGWFILGAVGLSITLPTVIAVLPYYEDFSDEEEEDRTYVLSEERIRGDKK